MKELEDPRFSAAVTIHPTYNNDSKQYHFQLQLTNNLPDQLHFYIASTFGFCLSETTKLRWIAPHSQISLKFKLKPTNLLGNIHEKVSIFGSKFKSAELFRLSNCYVTSTRLAFNEDNLMDPTIQQILQFQTAQQARQNGDSAKALSKYQQAYQIIRSSEHIVNEMACFRLANKDYEGAMRDIESALIWEMNVPYFLLLKIEVLMEWQDKYISEQQQIFITISQNFEFIKNHFPFYHISPTDKERLNKLFEKFKKYSKMTAGKVNSLLQHLYHNATDKISEDNPLLKLYNSKEELKAELRQILLQQTQEHITTPEEVLDPIGYEIMHKPYILPCGSSCEQQTLRTYFATNGYKDPITRQPINYEFVFRNMNLQNYIKQHPLLKKWQKYEFDYLHH